LTGPRQDGKLTGYRGARDAEGNDLTASNAANSKRRDAIAWVALAAILGVALFLRLDGLGSLGLGFDEPQHIFAARGYLETGAPELPSGKIYDRAFPYTRVVAWSLMLFGDDALAARLPSVLFGMLTVLLAFVAGRRFFGPIAGLVSALLLAVLPFEVVWSRACRMYSMYQFLYLLALYSFYRGFEAEREPGAGPRDLLNRWAARLPLVGEWKLDWPWLLLAAISFELARQVHALALTLGVGLTFYALCMALVTAVGEGRRGLLRSRHLWLFGLCIVGAAGFLAMPGQAANVNRIFAFHPSWTGYAPPSSGYYFDLLNSPGYFPLLVLFLLGTILAFTRANRAAFCFAVCAGSGLAFHSLLVQVQRPRYIYEILALVAIVAGFGVAALFEDELARMSERLRRLRLAPGGASAVAAAFLAAIFVAFFFLFSQGVRDAFRLGEQNAYRHGGQYNVDWEAACAVAGERVADGDLLVVTIPLAAELAGCPPVDYNLDNGESDQFRPPDAAGFPGHSFADLPAIIDYDTFERALDGVPRAWFALDSQRVKNPANVPAPIRAFLDESAERVWRADDGSIAIWVWERPAAPAASPMRPARATTRTGS
jgi:4-amino-4-deoxy-L-arabinose transferase-like glycosyltransferase